MTQLLPPKKEVALALLERSNVDVYLDPRAPGVVVPPQFRKEPRLILKIGLNMPVPIPDLHLDEESMSCTLSFSRSPFYCVVPWPSVFAIVGEDGRGMVWPDDVPQELAVRVAEERRDQDRSTEAPSSERNVTPAGKNELIRPAPRARARGRAGDESSRIAEPTPDRPSRPRKPRKKKDEVDAEGRTGTRPALVALPSEPRTPSAASAPGAAAEPREPREPRPKEGLASVPRAPQPGDRGPSRPKRELPPYLRVVK